MTLLCPISSPSRWKELSGSPNFVIHKLIFTKPNRVRDILDGRAESAKVLYRNQDTEYGFVILPDMKWDLIDISTLYLVAITQSNTIKTLRDLRTAHVPLLKAIPNEARLTASRTWGVQPTSLRMFAHYQPSYCMRRIYKKPSSADDDRRSFPCSHCQLKS